LLKFGDAGASSHSKGGVVPKKLAVELCNAFSDHAAMYDSLYEGKFVGVQNPTEGKLMEHAETDELHQTAHAEL
jgi:hypothetical protein